MDSLRKPPPSSTPSGAMPFSLGTTPAASHRPSRPETPPSKPVRRSLWRRLFLMLIIGGFLFIVGSAGLWFITGLTLTRSLHFENRELSFFDSFREVGKGLFQKSAPLLGETEGRVNVLLLGRAGERYPGKNLTDTVMVLSLNTQEQRAALLSLPRDLFVPIPDTDTSTKVNALYQIGLNADRGTELVRESVSLVTGLDIPYAALIDFDGFEKVIDTLGGIRVEVPRDFYDPRFPGKNYSYETFEIKAGWHTLDGATALKYARERHNDPEGDFGRAKRQQQILRAITERALSLPTFLNPFTLHAFLESLGESITTTIPPADVRRFLELARTINRQQVETVVVDAWRPESLLRVAHLDTPSGRAFLLVPRSGSWDEIQFLAANIFDREAERLARERMERETADIRILSAPSTLEAARKLQESLKREFPLGAVTLSSLPTLEKSGENAMIRDKTGLAKPFTLDALMKRYGFVKTDQFPSVAEPSTVTEADFVILFTAATFEDTLADPAQSEPAYDFQEFLPPQTAR